MKNKKLIIILGVFILIVLTVVLGSTIFTLQSESINWLTTRINLSGTTDTQIIGDNKEELGESIFLVNKSNIVNRIESNNPYIKVVSIEKIFPNKIVVHVAERESLFCIKLSDTKYYILDGDGKVLEEKSGLATSNTSGQKPILVTLNNITLTQNNFVVGERLKESTILSQLQSISTTLLESDYSSTNSKGMFSDITIDLNVNSSISFLTRYGISINIEKSQNLLTDKFLLGLSVYEEKQSEGITNGNILVWANESQSIYAEYED